MYSQQLTRHDAQLTPPQPAPLPPLLLYDASQRWTPRPHLMASEIFWLCSGSLRLVLLSRCLSSGSAKRICPRPHTHTHATQHTSLSHTPREPNRLLAPCHTTCAYAYVPVRVMSP